MADRRGRDWGLMVHPAMRSIVRRHATRSSPLGTKRLALAVEEAAHHPLRLAGEERLAEFSNA